MKTILLILLITVLAFSLVAIAKDRIELKDGVKTIYKYKKYEKFDFDEMKIDGETGSPGDLSIMPRYQRRFKNKLPYRLNFNAEIRKAIERVR